MADKANIVHTFVTKTDIPKYILGRNKYSTEVRKYVDITGYVDEKTSEHIYEGLPVLHSLFEIPSNAIVLSCVVEGAAWAVEEKLSAWGGLHIDYFSFIKYSGFPLSIEYWHGFKESYSLNESKYDEIRSLLKDELSKQTFDRLIKFKLDYDISQMSDFKMNLKEQYFEPFLDLKPSGESFCDVGGYDGATTQNFIKHCPLYDKIYYWEPDPSFMEKSKAMLSDIPNIMYITMGASDKNETLRFKIDGSASRIAEDGEVSIEVGKIDDVIKDGVSFIKMDIEGNEIAAINRARQTILQNHPILAICAYHKGDDFVTIPQAIFHIRKDYDIYLRHYTQGIFETVMFFVPKQK